MLGPGSPQSHSPYISSPQPPQKTPPPASSILSRGSPQTAQSSANSAARKTPSTNLGLLPCSFARKPPASVQTSVPPATRPQQASIVARGKPRQALPVLRPKIKIPA